MTALSTNQTELISLFILIAVCLTIIRFSVKQITVIVMEYRDTKNYLDSNKFYNAAHKNLQKNFQNIWHSSPRKSELLMYYILLIFSFVGFCFSIFFAWQIYFLN